MLGRVRVLGPAYLDQILRVGSPVGDPNSAPFDQSVGGRPGFGGGEELALVDPSGGTLAIDLPAGWPGPRGTVELDRPIGLAPNTTRRVRAESWEEDLGGMGAGFASALGGEVVASLGPVDDPASAAIEAMLRREGIATRIDRREQPADRTLLVMGGTRGDKLAVGFRESAEPPSRDLPTDPCDVLVVAGAPNHRAAEAMRIPGPRLRVLAPSMRNALDRDRPILGLIAPVDVLCCNRCEWEAMADREEIAARLSILVVTDGEAGASARFADPNGSARTVRVPAFPRARPPRDVNRAGEAFASFFLATLAERGWRPESCAAEPELVREAMTRAAAAAALTLDLTRFGFPMAEGVDEALARGVVD